MPKADKGQSDKHRKDRRTSHEPESGDDRMVTDEEWEDLLEDAEAFKEKHDKTFRILSGRDE
jgi:hypothetical protein